MASHCLGKLPFAGRLTCLAGAVALAASSLVEARVLDGETVTINQAENDLFVLNNASTINITDTGSTLDIVATGGSTVNIAGGSITSRPGTSALTLNSQSFGSLVNAVVHGNRFGVIVLGQSTMRVQGGSISGDFDGATLSAGSTLELIGTSVSGNGTTSPNGTGVYVLGANLHASQGTTITGEKHGIEMRQGTVAFGGGDTYATINATSVLGKTGSAIFVRHATAITGGTAYILVENGSELSGGNGNVLEVTGGMAADFTVDDSNLTGDVAVDAGSTAKVLLRNSALLNGNLVNVQSLGVDSGARWQMTQSAEVGTLALNGGIVDFTDRTEQAGFKTLTLDSLAGNGTFVMGADLYNGKSDFLNITGQAEGSHQLSIASTGLDPVKGQGPLQVVHTGGGTAQFNLQHALDYGTFAYTLEKGEGEDNWYLVQEFDDEGKPIVTPGTRSVIGLFSAAPTVWYGELSSLRTRMGELRLGQNQGGAWMRTYGNRYSLSAGSGVAYQQDQSGISFGADAPMPESDGRWLLGIMGGYSESDLDFHAGSSGEVKSYYVGAYSTWLAESGYYVDAVIKYNRFRNRADVMMSDGTRSHGDYDNNGLGGSVEVGKHIALSNDWYVEPFTQLSALVVGSDSYSLDNGMSAKSERADSVLGKVGAQVGRNVHLDNGGIVQPYLKVAAAHEFISSNRVKVNDNRFTNDLSGTRGEFAVGVAGQISDVLQLHGEFQYSNGEHIEQPYGINLGLRYSF